MDFLPSYEINLMNRLANPYQFDIWKGEYNPYKVLDFLEIRNFEQNTPEIDYEKLRNYIVIELHQESIVNKNTSNYV